MEKIFITSTNVFLTKQNIWEIYFLLDRLSNKRWKLNFMQLGTLRQDLRNFDKFILMNMNKGTIKNYTCIIKKHIQIKKELTKLINNKFKSL